MAKRLQAMGQSNYRDGFGVRVHDHMLSGCVFRSKSITENAPCRSPRTPHADQAIRSMPITEYARMPISFGHVGGIGDRHGRFPAGVT
jgi:hypothetical protein